MYGAIQAAHSARASEHTTGIVRYSGDSGSYTVTIYEEFPRTGSGSELSLRYHVDDALDSVGAEIVLPAPGAVVT